MGGLPFGADLHYYSLGFGVCGLWWSRGASCLLPCVGTVASVISKACGQNAVASGHDGLSLGR